jgi:hypothetical protein
MIDKKNKINTLIVEVDLNINTNGSSEGTRAMLMPFIQSNKTINEFYKKLPDYAELNYIPFYRYIEYDSKIGFREFFFSLINKKQKGAEVFGFTPLKTDERPLIPLNLNNSYPKKNKSYEEIKKICFENNITLIAITTPVCRSTLNRDYFNQIQSIYPEVHRLENVIIEDKYFSSCGHLNEKGASKFTEIVFNKFFNPDLKH